MPEEKTQLSEKDKNYREFSLNGNMWKVILYMGVPLALYETLNQLFKILDTMMASHISGESVSAVAYLAQISMTLSAIGGGLAIGASLKVSEAYGAGDYELVKKRVSSLYAICAVLGTLILLGILPFTEGFLKLAGTPNELIDIGKRYFRVELIGMVIQFFNNVYIAIERARGNSRRILYLNLGVIVVKLSFTAIFVYILNGDLVMISIATLISQLFLLVFALINMQGKNNAFGFTIKKISAQKKVIKPMIVQSIPVIAEKVAFSFGKVVVNAMSVLYGSLVVGALGISNNIGGIVNNPQNGFQAGAAAIISQNIGAGKYDRALDAFKKILIINIVIGIILFILTIQYLDFISSLFAAGDAAFQTLIIKIYRYESLGAVTLGVNAAVMALLYGLGKTKLTLLLNFSRIFVFRVPVLWYLQNFTHFGSESVGIVMMVSNVCTGTLAAIVAWIVIRRLKRSVKIDLLSEVSI